MTAGSRNRIKTCEFLTQICEHFDKNLKYFFSFIFLKQKVNLQK